jgi:hypothetical protein
MKTTESVSPWSEARNMAVAAVLLVIGIRAIGLGHAVFNSQSAWFQVPISIALGVMAYIGLCALVEATFTKLATLRFHKVETPVPIVVRSE